MNRTFLCESESISLGCSAANPDIMREASVGSEGHPHDCARPCKFAGRPQGCSKGASCVRCHLCEWHGRGLDPYPLNKDGTPWVYQAPPEKKPEKLRQPYGVAEATAAAQTLGGKLCQLGLGDNADYVNLCGVVTRTGLEDSILREFAPGYDLSASFDAVLELLRKHLVSMGFTAAPNSMQLVEIVGRISEHDVDALRRNPVLPPSIDCSRMVDACIAQLKRVLPSSSLVLGVYKSRARICDSDNASRLHKDDVLLTEGDVTKALFPHNSQTRSTPLDDERLFDRYDQFCADVRRNHPSLELPSCRAASRGDLSGFTRQLISSVQSYNEKRSDRKDELIFDNVNVWIPRDSKRIVLLPRAYSQDLQYPLSSHHIERLKSSLADKFQALPEGAALVFFGQSLLHQALMGESFDCGTGSLEGRYLVLSSRRHAHRGSLRDHLGLDLGLPNPAGAAPDHDGL